MPEGHTLHALAGRLDRAFAGRPVAASSPQGRFEDGAALLHGRSMVEAQAWGKHLFAEFGEERWLHVHLGLIGSFPVTRLPEADRTRDHRGMPSGRPPVMGSHTSVRLRLLGHEHVADLRGPNLCAVVTPARVAEVTARLGPDPLRPEADPVTAWERLRRSRKPVAELLMDQKLLAGVGNVYRCEVLFRRRVDPFRPGDQLRPRTWQAIWDDLVLLMPLGVAYHQILTMDDQVDEALGELAGGPAGRHTVTRGAAPGAETGPGGGRPGQRFDRRFWVYKRAGEPCRVCGSRVRTQVVAGRNLFWCGRCQRRR